MVNTVSQEERSQILKMVGEGKISAEEGARLLAAISTGERPKPSFKGGDAFQGRWLRVRVLNMMTGKPKVNVNLPLSLVGVGLKLGANFAPELAEFDVNELMTAIQEGAQGKILEVIDDEDGELVEVYIE
ncbi:MAG: SHOCT-like domain-containing protein [Chloroflexota bacterium]